MSSTKAIIERFLSAFNAGDPDAALACLADGVAHDINQGERQIGREAFRWYLAKRRRHFRETVADIAIMSDEGGTRAAAEFTLRGSYLASVEGLPAADGQTYALPAALFFEIDDGLISRVTSYWNETLQRSELGGK